MHKRLIKLIHILTNRGFAYVCVMKEQESGAADLL